MCVRACMCVCVEGATHRGVVQLLPEGEAGTVVALGVDVRQNRHEEGGGQPLGDQLPPIGLAELRDERRRGHYDGLGGGPGQGRQQFIAVHRIVIGRMSSDMASGYIEYIQCLSVVSR